uniref:Transmembrane protein 161B n=1 Tax=Ciona intestinalis TaxID=7719 RepID=F6WRB6_CIOIN|nr:transmembrane protein 161B [Ciona intestinalis]|eukprot:XP_002124040.1 transmembrane protein 161B [Ciona intestinalis]
MAIFGFQLCFTLIMACFLQKLMPLFSFGRWLLCNGTLVRYKHPHDDELKKLAKKPVEKVNGKGRHRRNQQPTEEKTFKVPRNIEISLEAEKINPVDVVVLRSYPDYEWLVDYSVFVMFVYVGTEVYYELWGPEREFNISMIWVGLSVWFAVKNMISILWLYASSKGGEISMSITFGMISFLCGLCVLMIKEDILEFGITSINMTQHNSTMVNQQFSLSGLKLLLAGFGALHGLLIAFPAIRMSQMYLHSLKYAKGNNLLNLTLHFNFFAPLVIMFLWVKPLARDIMVGPSLLTNEQFEIFRIIFILLACVLRLCLTRVHLQAYLNLAFDKLNKIKKESGLITNIELQRTIAHVFYYLGIVAMQYLSPLVLLLCSTLCLKSLGGFSWKQVSTNYVQNIPSSNVTSANVSQDSTFVEMVSSFNSGLHDITDVFTIELLRGVCSFIAWWVSTNWFIASCLGLLYHSYLVG